MTLVVCETCGQRVGTLGQAMAGDRRRVVPHKRVLPLGRFSRVDWCPGRFERKEEGS